VHHLFFTLAEQFGGPPRPLREKAGFGSTLPAGTQVVECPPKSALRGPGGRTCRELPNPIRSGKTHRAPRHETLRGQAAVGTILQQNQSDRRFEDSELLQYLEKRWAEGCHNRSQLWRLGNREIAQQLNLSEHTVKNYLFRIFDKLGISNRVELVLYAVTNRNKIPPASEPLEQTRAASSGRQN
jgi:hypothetical protein